MRYFSLLPLLGLAAAMPVNDKRDVVVQDVVVTDYVTTTIWIDPAEPTPNAFFEKSKSSSSSSSVSASSSSAAPSTTSAPPAAPTTTTAAAATTTPAAAAPVAAAAAPATGGGLASGTGQLTFYNIGMGIGSCGFPQASDSDYVVAVNSDDMNSGYGGNPNNNPMCGQPISITYNGITVVGKVYDSCPTCAKGDLDLSPGLFNNFGSASAGRLSGATWTIT
jgi:expansin (peptidoglycan-binding protein)